MTAAELVELVADRTGARPPRALTEKGWRLMLCTRLCPASFAAVGTQHPVGHTARLGSVYWTCVHCDHERESDPCVQEDFPFDPTPATAQTGNLAVTEPRKRCKCGSAFMLGSAGELVCPTRWQGDGGSPAELLPVTGQEVATCSVCHGVPATMSAYYAELGTTARLLPWCDSCAAVTAPLVVAAGFIVTMLPKEPLPSYAELRRQLDVAEQPDLRRMQGPRPKRGSVGHGG